MKKSKIIVMYDNDEPPRDFIKEKIGGHPSIEEYDYEQDENLDTDYCRAHVFDNYFE